MTDPPNTSSDDTPNWDDAALLLAATGQDAQPEGTLLEAVAAPETNTIYVLPEDILILPCGDQLPAQVVGTMHDVHDHLALTEMIVTQGVDRPWILRKATPVE